MLLLQLAEYLLAQKDYAACLELCPTNTAALFNRALLHFHERFKCFYSLMLSLTVSELLVITFDIFKEV